MRFSKFLLPVVLACCLSAMQGCKDSTNRDEDDSILGLWQLDSSEGDVSYINITDEVVTNYDYLGDDFDEGPDCYVIENRQILDVNGSKYTFTDPFDPNDTIEVEVTANGNKLTVVQPFGDILITLKFSKSNASISSFTPECEENQVQEITKSELAF